MRAVKGIKDNRFMFPFQIIVRKDKELRNKTKESKRETIFFLLFFLSFKASTLKAPGLFYYGNKIFLEILTFY